MRLVEGKLVVTRLLDVAEAKGVAIGDVVETIDGQPVAVAIADKRKLASASTDDARDQRAASNALGGLDGSTVKLGMRHDSSLKEAVLTRRLANLQRMWAPKVGPHWKKLGLGCRLRRPDAAHRSRGRPGCRVACG